MKDFLNSTDELSPMFSCAVIESRIIKNKEYMALSDLRQLHNTFDDRPNIHRNDRFKMLLSCKYPQLTFDQPKQRNQSECVYDSIASFTELTSFSESEPESMDSEFCNVVEEDQVDLHSLYYGGVSLKNLITQHDYKMPWPPSASNLSLNDAERAVPPLLYNFLALLCDKTDELPSHEFHKMTVDTHSKLLSLCQDIIYLKSNGQHPTPKSLSLGMTVKHMTRSAHLVTLLNSYGHSVSYDSVNRSETAIATRQLNNPMDIPVGFHKSQPTTVVLDNIDFCEETLSGSGSTHHVNGIMFQSGNSVMDNSLETEPAASTPISRRHRTIKPLPLTLEPFYLSKRQIANVQPSNFDAVSSVAQLLPSLLKEFVYIAVKAQCDQIAPWTGFQKQKTAIDNLLPKSPLHYLKVIEAPPTEMATVAHMLKCCVEKVNLLDLDAITVIFDLALYSKAQQIRWRDSDLQTRVVLRLGEFHTVMAFLGTIGKLFTMAGLEDILIESSVIASGSITGVLSGHMYNRSIRAHKVLYEALARLQFEQFITDQNIVLEGTILTDVEALYVGNADTTRLSETYKQYEDYINRQCQTSPTYKFWNMYLSMVRVLLMFIRATRDSDWNSHVHSLRLMLPYFFTMDRHNYSRYGCAYWAEMMQLSQTHPKIYQGFVEDRGCWTLRRSDKEPFSSIAGDQGIEQTVNRDCKISGGLRGITLNKEAAQRWYLTQSERAAIASKCEEMANVGSSDTLSKHLSEKRMKADENAVVNVMSTITTFINPWTYQENDLVSLISGVIAPDKVKEDVLSVKERGESAVSSFLLNRVFSDREGFYAPIKASKIQTFRDIKKGKTSQQGKTQIQVSDRSLYARLLIVGRSRDIDLETILTYPLSSISLPLANADGTMAKTAKSKLLQVVEQDCKCEELCVDQIVSPSALIIDAMALIQSLPVSTIPATFGMLADLILSRLCSQATQCKASRVDFVIDIYLANSLKNAERLKRNEFQQSDKNQVAVNIHNGEVRTPKLWKSYLSHGANKKSLLKFLLTHWQQCTINRDLILYMTTETGCVLLSYSSTQLPTVSSVDELACDHEEADTRLITHGIHASQSCASVIICSIDTDVAMLCLAHNQKYQCDTLGLMTGCKDKKWILDVKAMACTLGCDITDALLGVHAFTGCDVVSSFVGKGKATAFKLLSKHQTCCQAMKELGTSFQISDRLFSMLEQFTCLLYGDEDGNVNKLRFKRFVTSGSASHLIPPCRDSLQQHAERANYITSIWKRADRQKMEAPDPALHGWLKEDGQYHIKWHSGNIAPADVLKTVFCSCKKTKCQTGACACSKQSLICTELCRCVQCENCSNDKEETAHNPEDSDEEM